LFLALVVFALGLTVSALVGANNVAPSLSVLVSTNAIKRRWAYALTSISLLLGVSLGGLTMAHSVSGVIQGDRTYQDITLASVLVASLVTFSLLNRRGIPSSLSQMIYPSLAVLAFTERREISVDFKVLALTALSWLIAPLSSMALSLSLYLILSKVMRPRTELSKVLAIYKYLILISSLFVTFVTGANAIGLVASAGSQELPLPSTLLIYALASVVGLYSSSKRAVAVVGFRITKMGYIAGSSAMIGSSIVNELFTLFGIPISVTQSLLGGIIGLSFRSMTSDVNRQVRQVMKGWMTSPVMAVFISLSVLGLTRSLLGL
jgi:PiT family inorganic phosphate transporter